MIDTHAHVHVSAFSRDREDVLKRARTAGVHTILEVNIDAAGLPRVLDLCRGHSDVFATVGIHPHDTARATVEDLDGMAGRLSDPRVRAVGETGLDYYRDYAPHDVQRRFFRRHVALARESGLPLVVHARERPGGPSAHADIFAILAEEGHGRVRGVLHCFSGDLEIARRAVGLGFKLGLGGSFTYNRKRTAPLLTAIEGALGSRVFLLETDCPYLTPDPRRRERNEPASIPEIARVVAEDLGLSTSEIENLTDRNAEELFRFGGPMTGPADSRPDEGS